MGRKITKSKAKKNSRKNSKKKDKKKKKSSSVKNSAQVNSRKLPEPLSRMPTNEMALTPRFEASGTPETVARSPSPIGQSEITGEPPQLVPMPSSPDLPNIVDPVNISTQFRAGSSEGENPMSNQNDDLLAISRQDADLTHTESAPIDTAEIFKSFKAQHPLFKPTDFVGITFDLFLVALGTAFVTSSFSTHLNQSVHNDFLSGVPDAFEVMTVYGLASELSHQKDQSSQKISRPIEKTLWQKKQN